MSTLVKADGSSLIHIHPTDPDSIEHRQGSGYVAEISPVTQGVVGEVHHQMFMRTMFHVQGFIHSLTADNKYI